MNPAIAAISPVHLRIDFVSDVVCPWCAIGLLSLEQALSRLDGKIVADIHFQPFELNPDMPAGGEDSETYLLRKYGVERAQLARNREALVQRGAALGFAFGKRERIYNTFDAHRLLHWAGGERRQDALKFRLLRAYHGDGEDISSHEVLVRLAGETGLQPARAREILESEEFGDAVRERERFYQSQGIHAVPGVVVNARHLISGGQPADVFEAALKQIARVA